MRLLWKHLSIGRWNYRSHRPLQGLQGLQVLVQGYRCLQVLVQGYSQLQLGLRRYTGRGRPWIGG